MRTISRKYFYTLENRKQFSLIYMNANVTLKYWWKIFVLKEMREISWSHLTVLPKNLKKKSVSQRQYWSQLSSTIIIIFCLTSPRNWGIKFSYVYGEDTQSVNTQHFSLIFCDHRMRVLHINRKIKFCRTVYIINNMKSFHS